MMPGYATLCQGDIEVAKGSTQKTSDKQSIRLFDRRAEHCCGAYKVGYVALTLETDSHLNCLSSLADDPAGTPAPSVWPIETA